MIGNKINMVGCEVGWGGPQVVSRGGGGQWEEFSRSNTIGCSFEGRYLVPLSI